MEVFQNYYNLIESFWITREKVEEDFLTNNEIEAIREIENLLETVKEIIFEQDEDDANMRRLVRESIGVKKFSYPGIVFKLVKIFFTFKIIFTFSR